MNRLRESLRYDCLHEQMQVEHEMVFRVWRLRPCLSQQDVGHHFNLKPQFADAIETRLALEDCSYQSQSFSCPR